MNAGEFASLLKAKRVGNGKWIARCPAHGDKRPSLSIAEGRTQPIVFRCMSQGCTQEEVLAAMGLTWRDLMGERPKMSREARARFSDEQYLRDLRELRRFLTVEAYRTYPEAFMGPRSIEGLDELNRRIIAIENKLSPDLQRMRGRCEKTYQFVRKWGWDKLWEMFLEIEEGRAANAEWGRV